MKAQNFPVHLILATALFLLHVASSFAIDNWQTYKGVTVWTQYPNKTRTFTWSGTTDVDGKASGPGTYVVYLDAKKVVTYTGTMEAGRLTGHVTAIYYLTHKTYEGEIRDNSENGFGTMKDADGTVRTGVWADGKLVGPANATETATPSDLVTASPTLTPSASLPPKFLPAVRPAQSIGVVALAPGIEPPRANASPAEQFVYQLSVITRRYCLETTYRMRPQESVEDASWAKERAMAVARLLDSPLAAQVPESLRRFCVEALTLDAALQAIVRHRQQGAQRSRDEGMGLIDKMIGGLPGTMFQGSTESKSVEQAGLEMIFGSIARVQESEAMLGQFRAYKAKLDPHRRWMKLLATLAADDPGLRPFAAEPGLSDPSWHFMHDKDGGDEYFGNSRDLTRTGSGLNVNAVRRDVGDVTKGPIRVHFKAHSLAVGYVVEFKGTAYKEVFVAHCRRGHFGIYGENGTTAWAARGMQDSPFNGKFSYDNTIAGRPVTYAIGLWHLATTGEEEDLDVDGEVLIYLDYQYHSDAEAARVARDVYLH